MKIWKTLVALLVLSSTSAMVVDNVKCDDKPWQSPVKPIIPEPGTYQYYLGTLGFFSIWTNLYEAYFASNSLSGFLQKANTCTGNTSAFRIKNLAKFNLAKLINDKKEAREVQAFSASPSPAALSSIPPGAVILAQTSFFSGGFLFINLVFRLNGQIFNQTINTGIRQNRLLSADDFFPRDFKFINTKENAQDPIECEEKILAGFKIQKMEVYNNLEDYNAATGNKLSEDQGIILTRQFFDNFRAKVCGC